MFGEHNTSVLEKYPGLSGVRVAELEAANALHREPH
jgi:hypothetical protein